MTRAASYAVALACLVILWQAAAWLAGPTVVASPLAVAALLGRELPTQLFWRHVGASCLRVVAALAIAFVTAVPLGLCLGSSRRLDRWSRPLIYLSYPVPKIVLLPLVFLVAGIGDAGKIAMLSLILFFQLLVSTRDAALTVGRESKYSLYSLGGGRRDLFAHVIWPASLPAVFSSLRVATGTVVAVLFFVESLGTRHGLGFYILDAWGRAATAQIFVGILALAALGVVLYELFDGLEKTFCRWQRA